MLDLCIAAKKPPGDRFDIRRHRRKGLRIVRGEQAIVELQVRFVRAESDSAQ